MTASNLQTLGIVGSTPIVADIGAGVGSAGAVSVVLTSDYAMLGPAGYPSRPSFTGAATPQYPHTISSGATLSVLAPEALALVDAGAANYL